MHLDRMQRERLVARVERDLHMGHVLDAVATERPHREMAVDDAVVRLEPGLEVGQQVLDAATGTSWCGPHFQWHGDGIDPCRPRLEQQLARRGRTRGPHRQCHRRDHATPTPRSTAVPDGARHAVHPIPPCFSLAAFVTALSSRPSVRNRRPAPARGELGETLGGALKRLAVQTGRRSPAEASPWRAASVPREHHVARDEQRRCELGHQADGAALRHALRRPGALASMKARLAVPKRAWPTLWQATPRNGRPGARSQRGAGQADIATSTIRCSAARDAPACGRFKIAWTTPR